MFRRKVNYVGSDVGLVTCAICNQPGRRANPTQRTCGSLRCKLAWRRQHDRELAARRKDKAAAAPTKE